MISPTATARTMPTALRRDWLTGWAADGTCVISGTASAPLVVFVTSVFLVARFFGSAGSLVANNRLLHYACITPNLTLKPGGRRGIYPINDVNDLGMRHHRPVNHLHHQVTYVGLNGDIAELEQDGLKAPDVVIDVLD